MTIRIVLWIISGLFTLLAAGQSTDTLIIKNQASAWINYNRTSDHNLYSGCLDIPMLNYRFMQNRKLRFELEASANFSSYAGTSFRSRVVSDYNAKPYRIWAKASGDQFEVRLGLQKINFGPSNLFRPMMWFDRIDPRDPLQLTEGVWGLLFRYYFKKNSNLWLWALYGNEKPKTWEIGSTSCSYPELGGRFQSALMKGEAALSYHFRATENDFLPDHPLTDNNLFEHRIGIDGRWDYILGFWVEAAWIHKRKIQEFPDNQELMVLGVDYTFRLGRGLYCSIENLGYAFDKKPFTLTHSNFLTGFSLAYPLGILDQLSAIIFIDWKSEELYRILQWKRDYNHISLILTGYSNPNSYVLPGIEGDSNFFAGTGIQAMIILNH
jgi:hypothetical protein